MPKNFNANFRDSFVIEKPTDNDISIWKDSFGDNYSSNNGVLRVVMEATHSALINLNNRFYIPSKMKDGVLTWLNGAKPAKVLKHHNMHDDPVGIIRGARFVETVPEELKDNPDVAILLSSSAEVSDQIEAMKGEYPLWHTPRKNCPSASSLSKKCGRRTTCTWIKPGTSIAW